MEIFFSPIVHFNFIIPWFKYNSQKNEKSLYKGH